MKITSVEEKVELLNAFEDPRNTVLILLAGSNPAISQIHEKAVEVISDPDWKIFWVTDSALLTDKEKQEWCGAENQYVTLSCMDDSSKRIKKLGTVGSLCMSSGKPSVISIKKAFTDARL